jgi:ribosomal protein L17
MTDQERVKLMHDMNWKPAQTYWKEQRDKLLKLYQSEIEYNEKLESVLEKAEALRNVLEDLSDRDTYLSRRASLALQDFNKIWVKVFDE